MQPTGKARRITGWILSGLLGAMLMFSATLKLIAPQPAVELFEKYGWSSLRISRCRAV